MEATTGKKREEKHRFWERHLQRWRSPGLSQRAYCQGHQLAPQQFSYWKKRFVDGDKHPLFVQLPLGQTLSEKHHRASDTISVVIRDRYRIGILVDFDANVLIRIIWVLDGL